MVTQPGRGIGAFVTLAALALIAFFTLRPATLLFSVPTFCVFCGPLGGVDFILNTALFVPLGIGLRWLTGRWTTSAVIGLATTLLIEILQWRVIAGRDASLGDLIANTIGTLLGSWLAVAAVRGLNASAPDAKRMAAAFGIITSVLIAVSALLLLPAVPRWAQYVQWTPERPNMDVFRGRLVSVELNGRLLQPRQILRPQWAVDSATGTLSVRAELRTPIPPSTRPAIIVRIANDREEGFQLVQRGEAVLFRSHQAAVRLKLRPLIVGLDGALPASNTRADEGPGVLMVTGSSNPRAISVEREQATTGEGVTLRRTVGLAWALLLPWDVPLDPSWWAASALWLGALVTPVAFFVMRSGHGAGVDSRPWLFLWPLLVVLATMAAVPAAMGLSGLGVGEWFGVIAGAGFGGLLERRAAAVEPPSARSGEVERGIS